MPRLGKFTVRIDAEIENGRQKYRNVDFIINVNSEGLFTTTLDEDLVFELEQAGIDLRSNGRRGSRNGFFSADTKDKLCKLISSTFEELYSREMILEEKIIRYSIASCASFWFTEEGEIIPNGSWRFDGKPDESRHWQKGTIVSHASDPYPVGLQLYVKPLYKRVYKYKSGKEITEYERVESVWHNTQLEEDDYHWKWLANITCTIPPRRGKLQEIPYTEKNAEFFVNMFKTVCQMASVIAKFTAPEEMIKLIESGNGLKLLGDG